MLQTAFRPSCISRTSVCEKYKRFKEDRDDERCRRSKEVRTQKMIGQIRNFIDKNRSVTIKTINALFDISVETAIRNEDASDLRECISPQSYPYHRLFD